VGALKRALALAGILGGLSLSSAARASRSCTEVSDIVGHQKCAHYGSTWSTEDSFPLTLGVNASYLSIAPQGRTFKGGMKVGTRVTPVEYDGSALGKTSVGSGGFGLRVTGFLLPFFYVGVEYGITLGRTQPGSLISDGASFARAAELVDTTALFGGAVFGLRLPLGRVSARGDLLLGGYGLDLSQSVTKGALTNASVPMSTSAPLFEPRVAVDLWATPWVTLSGSYGRNLVDHGTQSLAGIRPDSSWSHGEATCLPAPRKGLGCRSFVTATITST
jgi:hypothetical protein